MQSLAVSTSHHDNHGWSWSPRDIRVLAIGDKTPDDLESDLCKQGLSATKVQAYIPEK